MISRPEMRWKSICCGISSKNSVMLVTSGWFPDPGSRISTLSCGTAAGLTSLKEKIAAAEDASAAIAQEGLAGNSAISAQTLDLFVSVYGAEAGNLALRGKAIGGVYVGGGIAPKLIAKLKDGTFMRGFLDKGRYRELLSSIPVRVILNDQAALQGAAFYAAFRASG